MIRVRELLGGASPWVIAEIGVNHNGRLSEALSLVDLAGRCGVQAVKFQAFRAERLVRRDTPLAAYQARNLGTDPGGQYAMLKSLEIDLPSLAACAGRARELGLAFGVTPFDEDSLREILALEPDFLKIGSGDADNLPLLEAARASDRPVLVSTGMCDLADAARIVGCFAGAEAELALLHCVSAYPAPLAEANLGAIETLRARYGEMVGYSDHTMGAQAALIAAAMGAVAIEKHITNDPMRQGPDHRFSATPDILLDISKAVAEVALARGGGAKATSAVEADNKVVGRRSAFALRDLPTGHLVVREDFRFVRPGVGIPPNDAGALVGQRLARDVPKGHPITYDAISRRGMT